ncbi:MAG: phenylalanine--tRNA ligase subunit beta [Acidimicrobiia bacterium]
MKVTLAWLREFAPFPTDDPVALGEVMSDLGMAVESIERIGEGLDGIVVARVLALRPHPDADRIQLVDVDRGDGEALQICCGAFNMSVGDLVPLATLGTVMPGGMEIARRKMRGEWSNGMLCSGRELGLGDDHEGILLLDGAAAPGVPITDALGIASDVVFDLDVTPNRPDAMSVAGVARDLAARLGLPFAIPEPVVTEIDADVPTPSVEIVDPDLCGRFHVRVLTGVQVGPSPTWIADRLRAVGLRSINNVVDASNYVMLELGQPNHTYDLATVPDVALRVRWARAGESITTLDGVDRTLTPGRDGVIADRTDTPIGIAGVMGGASTEISERTTTVLLECAWWQPLAVARSSKFMGLRSEASARFERGVDPEGLDRAARRLAELLAPSGARLVRRGVTVDGDLPQTAPVRVRTARVNALLGTDLGADRIAALLGPIGFVCVPDGDDAWSVTVPTFRPDTTTETDVIEEIARHHGYSNIIGRLPASSQTGALTQRQRDRRVLRAALVGMGLHEAMPLPFLAPGDLDRCGLPGEAVTLANPLAAEESVLRTSLRPGLLRTVIYNESHRSDAVALFEIGRVFGPPVDGSVLPDEREHLAVVLAGRDATAAAPVWWTLASTLALPEPAIDQSIVPVGLHPGRSGVLRVAGTVVGEIGEIDSAVRAAMGLRERVAWLHLDLDAALAVPHGDHAYRRISRFPSSDLDLAFEIDDTVAAAEVTRAIEAAAGELLVRLDLFDVFRGEPVAAGRRSLAFRLRLQATDRTLDDGDITAVQRAVVDAVGARGGVLRG